MLLTFTRAETELPEEECEGPKPPTERPCLLQACEDSATLRPDASLPQTDGEMTYHWEYAGFTPCTATCLGGTGPFASGVQAGVGVVGEPTARVQRICK